jgi:hypothetical protein
MRSWLGTFDDEAGVLFAEKLQEAIYLNGALLKNSLQIPANSTLMDTFSANLDLGNSVKRHLLQQDQLIDAARTATARHWNATPANWHPHERSAGAYARRD